MLDRVTITGADDCTPISAMLDMCAEFPFVEFGILVSKVRQGSPRYPGAKWTDALASIVGSSESDVMTSRNVSMHVCGQWARRIFDGGEYWRDLPSVKWCVGRIQVNGTPSRLGNHANHRLVVPRQWIFQLPRAVRYIYDLRADGIDAAGLFDESGGKGVAPSSVSREWPNFYCGEAGGIGPNNIIDRIDAVVGSSDGRQFWIDMEGRVRDSNDRLDLKIIREILVKSAAYVGSAA